MADYNIYIRTVGGGDGSESPTTPFQVGGGDGVSTQDASQFISKAGAFAQNPDSAIGAVADTAVGAVASKVPWIGIAILAAKITWNITDNIISKYNDIASSASGDYDFKIKYTNWKRAIHVAFHPFSTTYERWAAELEITKANVKNQQERLLTGGTILNSPYGRYL